MSQRSRSNGIDQQALEQYLKHKDYMAAYNKRPDVKAKRTLRNKERWQKMKQAYHIAKDSGLV
jgi:hypothetical protein